MRFIPKILVLIVVFGQSFGQTYTPWIGLAKDENWLQHHEKLVNQSQQLKDEIQIVFIGDSVTEKWLTDGIKLWNKYYVPRHAYNYGISGDRTENVIYRVEHKEFDGLKPKAVILKIGTNNIANEKNITAEAVAKGINEIVRLLKVKMPTSPILLLGILPREKADQEITVQEINKIIAKNNDNHTVHYFDMSDHFQTGPGKRHPDLFIPNSAHLTEKGYEVWYEVMEPVLKNILNQ